MRPYPPAADPHEPPLTEAEVASLSLVDPGADAFRAAFADLQVDVVDGVLDALNLPDVGLASVFAGLAEDASVDLADAVLAGLDDADAMLLSAFGDGELQGDQRARLTRHALRDRVAQASLRETARTAAQVREATAAPVDLDLWNAVAIGISAELEPELDVGDALRTALRALPPVDLSASIMAKVSPLNRRTTRWVSYGAPFMALAAAAIVLLAIVPGLVGKNSVLVASLTDVAVPFQIASVNDAQVEDLETSTDVTAQVVQFEDGGPTFILVDDSAPSGGTL